MFCLFSSGELTSIYSGELTLTKMLLFNTWCKLLSWKVVPGVKNFILGNFLPFDNDLFTPPIVNLYTRNILLDQFNRFTNSSGQVVKGTPDVFMNLTR